MRKANRTHRCYRNLHIPSHLPNSPHSPPGISSKPPILCPPLEPPIFPGFFFFFFFPLMTSTLTQFEWDSNSAMAASPKKCCCSTRQRTACPRGGSVAPERTRGLSGLAGTGRGRERAGARRNTASIGIYGGAKYPSGRTSPAAPLPLVPNLNRDPAETW